MRVENMDNDRRHPSGNAAVRISASQLWRLGYVSVLATAFVVILGVPGLSLAQGINRNPGWPGDTLSGVKCYGRQGKSDATRFDYSEKDKLIQVEAYHFTRDVQALAQNDKKLTANFDYTLRSIPNHHRALWLKATHYMRMIDDESKRQEIEMQQLRREGFPPPECYFHRGKAFNPGDGMVPAIFAIYLHKLNKYELALAEYDWAERILPNNAEIIYNKGLLYVDMGKLDKARVYADKAQALGYPLKGLQRRILAAEAEEISATE